MLEVRKGTRLSPPTHPAPLRPASPRKSEDPEGTERAGLSQPLLHHPAGGWERAGVGRGVAGAGVLRGGRCWGRGTGESFFLVFFGGS